MPAVPIDPDKNVVVATGAAETLLIAILSNVQEDHEIIIC